ncbi:hypothetical protein ACGFNU_35130 [Spirillospora sp. NPDC048911]|uniref:hypothetical protein n=1 Tax=Spirillospora sp. NPDC048911 TaxID=3364527 RepID=UPI00371E6156
MNGPPGISEGTSHSSPPGIEITYVDLNRVGHPEDEPQQAQPSRPYVDSRNPPDLNPPRFILRPLITHQLSPQSIRRLSRKGIRQDLLRPVQLFSTLRSDGTDGPLHTCSSGSAGLNFSPSTEDLIETVIELWTADVQRRKCSLGSVDVTALTHPAFEWLLASAASPRAREGRRRVGMSDVEAIRSTSAMFAGLDNRFGGAHSRTAAVQYLSDQVTPLLSGSYSSSIASTLFSAVADLYPFTCSY